ncbi:hypothetical protein EYS42_08755 [Aquabacterium lacunae]|uniref:Uncharacterized protein n=1 Tax=Aquabacterium lacunae TaxID=2528630 RepID=A0A4Q9GYK7_9BURK|nr:hypothetical protein [Aquabacterium lacunae]TBO31325.1 hypothetical protein EYS42_08755 [Aquabacterium lacunae]
MAAPIIHLNSLVVAEVPPGTPRVISTELRPRVADVVLAGGGGASVDVGDTPAALPASGWALTAGTNAHGFSGGRVKAQITGNGTGAAGFFTIASNGTLSGLTITQGGSGYTGTVTATPVKCPQVTVLVDLGTNWHQYTRASLHLASAGGDSCLRLTAEMGMELGAINFMPVAYSRSTGALSEMWLQPWHGGSPAAMMCLGSRYFRFRLELGQDVGSTTAFVMCAMPQ